MKIRRLGLFGLCWAIWMGASAAHAITTADTLALVAGDAGEKLLLLGGAGPHHRLQSEATSRHVCDEGAQRRGLSQPQPRRIRDAFVTRP